jgi:hypothetical protein
MIIEMTSVVCYPPIFPVPADTGNEKCESRYQQYLPDDGFSGNKNDCIDITDKHECPDGNPVEIS